MNIEDTVFSHKNFNGLQLVNFTEVALPIYRISAIALVQEKVDLPTIEEFILRSINLGFESVEEISQLLGISQAITKFTLTSLIQGDMISEQLNNKVRILDKGAVAAGEYSKIRPSEKQVIFDYDGILRTVRVTADDIYLQPRELSALGLKEIRAIPAKGPSKDEIDVQNVSRFLSSRTSFDESKDTLLRIREVRRSIRLFYKADMLIYKHAESDRHEAVFFIDGKLLEAHEAAFSELDGLGRLNLLKGRGDISREQFETRCRKIFPSLTKLINKSKSAFRNARLSSSLNINQRDDSQSVRKSLDEKNQKASKNVFKYVEIYEYTSLLTSALETATQRLIIISPCITRSVVDRFFKDSLEKLLKQGVEVKIGYKPNENEQYSHDGFDNLDKKYKNFVIKAIDNADIRVLIKDDDLCVITSFDWLSYKGDAKRVLCEEFGNYTNDSEFINELYSEVAVIF